MLQPPLLDRVVLSAFSGVGKYYIGTDFEGESRIVTVRAHEASAITNDGVNHVLACFVVKRAPLLVHAEQHYGIQAHEYRSVFKPNCPREVLRSDVEESGRPKVGFQRTGVAKAVTTVGNRSDVSFRNTAQFVQQRKLLVRTPGAHAQSATFHQSAMHLPGGCRSTHEELKPLLTEDDIKLFAIEKRKGDSVAFPPVNRGINPPCDGEHLRIQVDANNLPGRTLALLGHSRNDPGSARDIENAVAWPEFDVLKQRLDPRLEERADQGLLIDLGETCVRKQTRFPTGLFRGLRRAHAKIPP
jgi:hypothetical protein